MTRISLPIEKCRENAVLPKYAHDGDAGMDLYSCVDKVVLPGETCLIPVGLKMANCHFDKLSERISDASHSYSKSSVNL